MSETAEIDFEDHDWSQEPRRTLVMQGDGIDETQELGWLGEEEGDLAGQPTLHQLGVAIQTITAHAGWKTVGELADIFSVPAERVWKAVGCHGWMFTVNDVGPFELRRVEHEGV